MFERQRPIPIEYKGCALDCGYRLDIVVEDEIVVELKACARIEPIHEAQLLTYLKLSGFKLGLILNFNVAVMKDGIKRIINGQRYETWGPAVAEDFFHGFSGWLIFIFGLAVLLLEMWVLSGFRTLRTLGASAIAKKNVEQETENRNGEGSLNGKSKAENGGGEENRSTVQRLHGFTLKSLLSPPQFIVAVILLAGTLALAQGVEFREKTPTARPFAEFPTQVGEWGGKRDVMEQKFIDGLHFNDYIIVDYVSGGHEVNFYTAYYESQRKGESIHSPETCLPGSGWEFRKARTVAIPLGAGSGVQGSGFSGSTSTAGAVSTNQRINGSPPTAGAGSTITVNRAVMEKGAYKQLSYFWFPQRDRVLTNAWELKIYNFWDALTRQRTDGALVRLITPVYPNEDVDQAEQRLTAFTQAIVPVLNEYLPK